MCHTLFHTSNSHNHFIYLFFAQSLHEGRITVTPTYRKRNLEQLNNLSNAIQLECELRQSNSCSSTTSHLPVILDRNFTSLHPSEGLNRAHRYKKQKEIIANIYRV